MRMQFPHYNIEDIVAGEHLLVEHLGIKHLVAVMGFSMGGRQTWQWGVQYPEFMDVLVPMGSSPFPLIGRRSNIDFLVEAIIKADPAWKNGDYQQNPPTAHLTELMYEQFLRGPRWFDKELPTRDDSRKWVATGRGHWNDADANNIIYQMELNNDYDAWSQIDRIRCPVLMINTYGDQMMPLELEHAGKVTSRMKNVTYLEIQPDSQDGHLALPAKAAIWAPKLREWLADVRRGQ
jgi:homoserine O-acetyltransferase/O-succinyltransferase